MSGRAQAETNRQYGIVVRRERGALVAYQRIQVIQGEDLQKLSAEDRSVLEAYESSMNEFQAKWKVAWSRRSKAANDIERQAIDKELRLLVVGMQGDLHGVLDFLAKQGMVLEDHYRHVRALVDQLISGGWEPPPALQEHSPGPVGTE